MTYAPADLLAVRLYLLTSAGLSGDAVGIVGDPDHIATGGYHVGNDDLARIGRLTGDYSKRESARDRPGTDGASALDIGEFVKGPVSLRTLSLGLVAACVRGDPRAADIREVIYTPDGVTVRRFDRLGVRSTGDSSHLFHTHLSFFRDSEGRRAQADNVLGLLRELIEGTGPGGDDEVSWDEKIGAGYTPGGAAYGDHSFRTAMGYTWYRVDEIKAAVLAGNAGDEARDKAATAAIQALAGALQAAGGSVDAAPILAAIAEAKAETTAAVQLLLDENRELSERLAAAYAPPAGG